MATSIGPDSLHRLMKHAIDSGRAHSVAAAEEMFRGYRVSVEISAAAAEDPVSQATLLTAVAVGRRVFLGGVFVTGELGARLACALPLGDTLADAVLQLGGRVGSGSDGGTPTVVVGGTGPKWEGFCIRTLAAGWRGGIVPIHSETAPEPGPAMPLAGMLAGALAVNEAYSFVSGDPVAGRRIAGMSLWQPDRECDWLVAAPEEPQLAYLPSDLWLIGLGHLGQAYLWGLGLLPYREPAEVSLVLQDVDMVTCSTESTSILTDSRMVGRKKTRVMAEWAEARGFETSIYERLFDAECRRQAGTEPPVALCGLDNAEGRRAMDQVGFDMVVEAGLGRGYRDFRAMRLHTLPGSRPASEIWKPSRSGGEKVEEGPAYTKLLSDNILDQCGVTLLAGKAVGAPFVGAVAATLALSEVLRALHGGGVHQMIDLDLMSVDHRVVSRHPRDFSRWNPGFTAAD